MFDTLRENAPQIAQSMLDVKTATAAIVTTGSAITAVTVEANNTFSLNEVSVLAAIFAASMTGTVMILNGILRLIEIRKALKKDGDC